MRKLLAALNFVFLVVLLVVTLISSSSWSNGVSSGVVEGSLMVRMGELGKYPERRMFGLKGMKHVRSGESDEEGDSLKYRVGRMKHLPFLPTRMHPFESDYELKRAMQQDPYMKDHVSSSLYAHSEKSTRQALLNGNQRSIKKVLTEGVDFVNVKENSNYVEHGSLHSISYDANVLSGVAMLDQDENVWDVTCEGNSIKVDFANGHATARQWIPGTRIVVGREWNCFGRETSDMYGKEDQLAFLVMSRTILSNDGQMLKIKFNVKSIQNNELFLSGKVKYHTVPIAKESGDRNMTSALHSSEKNKARYSYTERIASVGFNYENGNVKDERIIIYQSKDGSAQFVCDHCYIYLNMEFRMEFEWSWNSIDKAEAIIEGNFDSEATLKGSVIKSYQTSYNKVIEGKPIYFIITVVAVPFPVEIIPKIGLSVNVNADGNMQYSRYFRATYNKYLGLKYSTENQFGYIVGGQGLKWESSSPGLTVTGQAHADFSIYPAFDVTIMKLAKTSISVIPKLLMDLESEGFAQSLNQYNFFVKLDTYYLVDFEMENEYLGKKAVALVEKTTIPSLSGTYKKQKDSFKAITSASFFSDSNEIAQISEVTTSSDSSFSVRITSSNTFSSDWYFIKYAISNEFISNPVYQYQTGSKDCQNSCLFSFPLYNFIYLEIYQVGYLRNSKDMTKYFDLRHYISNPLSSSRTLDSESGRTFSIDVSRLTFKYKALPANPVQVTNPTDFVFDGQSNPYMDSLITVFKSDKNIALSSPFVSYPNSDEFVYMTESSRFSITTGLASQPFLTFSYVLPYRNVPAGSIVKLNGKAIRDSQTLTTFSQELYKGGSSKCSVTIQTRGSFDLILSEVWKVYPANFYQTKGKKFSFTESAAISNDQESSLPLRSHTFVISLENSYTNSEVATQQYIFAQIIPVGGVIVESIRFDPIQVSEGTSFTSRIIVEQQIDVDKDDLISPYLSVKTSYVNNVQLYVTNSLEELLVPPSQEYSVSNTETNIPLNPNNGAVYISPKTAELVDAKLVHNFKLLNGIPSIVKKINNKERGYFAYPCTNPSMHSGFIRVIDSNSGSVIQESDVTISARLLSKENLVESIEIVRTSGGIFSISRMDSVGSLCKKDPSNRYIQFIVQSSSETNRFIQVEISQTIEFSKLVKRSNDELIIDQEESGLVFIDLASERNKYQSEGKKGLVVTVKSLDSCNIDMYVNRKDQLVPPSFSSRSSIQSSASSLSEHVEKIPISLLNQQGSILMLYSSEDTRCRLTISSQELKETTLSLTFYGEHSNRKSSISSNGETMVIQVEILDSNHGWDKNFIYTLATQPNEIFNYFNSSNFSMKDVFSSASIVLFNEQTILVEFVPKSLENNLNPSTEIRFIVNSEMFNSRFNIQPRNVLAIDPNFSLEKQEISSASTSLRGIIVMLIVVLVVLF